MEELKDVKKFLPPNAEVEDLKFEASDIVIYTSDKDFFLDNSSTVKDIVSELKKRVEVRPSSKLYLPPEKAEKKIEEIIDEEAGLDELIFQPSLGKVIIRAEKPGSVIGQGGSGLDKIKEKSLWAPQVERVPSISSKVVDRARELTVEDPEFRKDFLHDVGEKIRLEKSVGDEWIRIAALGGCRQVGRSCFLLQTEESNVLMDAGIDPSAEAGSAENYPYLNAPELNLQDLDAVVLSHAHMDHCLTPDTPVTMGDGTRKPIAQVEEGEKLKAFNWETGELEEGECTGVKEVEDSNYLEIKTAFNNLSASGDHRFFRLNNLEVEEVKASELEEGDFIPRNSVKRNGEAVELEEPDYRERIKLTEKAKERLMAGREEKQLSRTEASQKAEKGTNFVYELEENYDSVYKDGLKSLLNVYDIEFRSFMERNSLEITEYPNLNEKLAQILGYFYGDGHRDGNRLRITDKNVECLKVYLELVEDLFNHRSQISKHPDCSKNAYQLEVNNVGIVKFLEANFPTLYEKNGIPSEIVHGNEDIVKGFLRGFTDAEGDVNQSIRIAQKNEEVRKQVQNLLFSLNIDASLQNGRVAVSRGESIRKFVNMVGASHPDKKEKMDQLLDLSSETQEKMPVTSEELHCILEQAGMKGQVNGSPDYSDLPTCLVDWYRRNPESYATRQTVEKLLAVLEERVETLVETDTSVRQLRKSISTTQQSVAESTSGNISQVQKAEKAQTEFHTEVKQFVEEKKAEYIEKTKDNIKKLRNLLEMDLEWKQITNIQEKENEYGYLVDIRVDPHHNFLANDTVVHNCGMIPYLYKMGYDGPLYCTKPTRDLMIMQTLDYIGIAHKENQKAPYDSSAIQKAVKRTITPDFGEVTDITPDMRLTLKNAGHVIGSSLCHIHVGEGLHNILYSGDYNYDQSEMLRPADTNFQRVETMITESTYGGNGDRQQPREESQKQFLSKMKQTLNKGGKVIVPVFALGRSQEILGMLADEIDRDYFDFPVYMDGMINDVNALHTAYPEFLSEKVQDKIMKKDDSPFLKDGLSAIASYEKRKQVIDEGPAVILTTSGMVTGGPVMEYLKYLAPEEKNAMIFVGYQANGTLGREIENGADRINVDGEEVDVNLDVHSVKGFSAHSDRQQIINFCRNLRSSPNKVLCNHGEEKKCFQLASSLHKSLHIDTSAPQNLEIDRLN